MTYAVIWFIGVILCLLGFKWMKKEFYFDMPYDQDGLKIFFALTWPIVAVVMFCTIISESWSYVAGSETPSSRLTKLTKFLGELHRKYL